MTDLRPVEDRDARKLAELGYKQELERAWSGFSNFAISFTITSVLAGCFTTYGQAWNNGGPIAISIAWPLICGLVLIVAFCMSELASAYPTAGGPYQASPFENPTGIPAPCIPRLSCWMNGSSIVVARTW